MLYSIESPEIFSRKPLLDICLATYNGAPWIGDFLLSLERQTYDRWRLIVSDDGSEDGTLDIIRVFFSSKPNKLLEVRRKCVGEGIIRNFQESLKYSQADYVLLADQDDVWLPEKLATLLKEIQKLEDANKLPAILFSDMLVVDENLDILNNSWWNHCKASSKWALLFKNVLSQNTVPGCSVIMNRRLLDVALPIPAYAQMHDWWLLLVSVILGKVGSCPEKTMLYRRHSRAATYSETGGIVAALGRFIAGGSALREDYKKTISQGIALEETYASRMCKHDLELLQEYIESAEKNWLIRRWLLLKNRIRRTTIKATIRFYFWV